MIALAEGILFVAVIGGGSCLGSWLVGRAFPHPIREVRHRPGEAAGRFGG